MRKHCLPRRTFGREVKLESVKLVTERRVTVAQAAKDVDVHENVLRNWFASFVRRRRNRHGLGVPCRCRRARSVCGRGADIRSIHRRHDRMAAWLVSIGIETVAMESTGVYWVPAYEVQKNHGLDVTVAHAREARAVPGRKRDVNDALWAATSCLWPALSELPP